MMVGAQLSAVRRPMPLGRCTRRGTQQLVAKASPNEAALKQMQEFKKGLANRLQRAEADWKRSGVSTPKAVAANTPGAVSTAPPLEDLTKDNYWETINGAENDGKLVVIDFYTDWCGPCKLIYPQLCEMAAELAQSVSFYKFNCNTENKDLGVELGIKVAPTFHIYKKGEKVAMMTGARTDELRKLITKCL